MRELLWLSKRYFALVAAVAGEEAEKVGAFGGFAKGAMISGNNLNQVG